MTSASVLCLEKSCSGKRETTSAAEGKREMGALRERCEEQGQGVVM